MKLQSTIIGRVLPVATPTYFRNFSSFKRNVSYYCRYWKEPLTVIGIFAAVFGFAFLIVSIVNGDNNQTMQEQAKLYHYAVGSTIKCNPAGDHNVDSDDVTETTKDGWFDCKVVAVSKDNYYYTTSYYNKDSHKTETYKFQIQYVSNK